MIFIICEYTIFSFSYLAATAIISVYLAEFLHFNAGVIGAILMVAAVTSRSSRILAAPIINAIPSRQVMPIMCFATALGYFLLSSASNIWLIGFSLFLIGFGYASNSMYVKALVAEYQSSKNSLLLRYAGLNVCFNIAAALAPLFSTYVFTHIGPQSPFFISSLILFGATPLAYFFHSSSTVLTPQVGLWYSFKKHLANKRLNSLFLLTILTWMVYAQLGSALPLYVTVVLNQFDRLGPLLFMNAIIVIVLSYPLAMFLSRYSVSSNTLLLWGFFLYFFGFGMIIIGGGFIYVTGAVILWTLGEILMIPALSTFLAEASPPEMRTNTIGLNSIAVGVGEGIGGFIGATTVLFHNKLHQGNLAFIYIAGIAFLGMLLAFYVRKSCKTLDADAISNTEEH
ncbi:MFS transporter [Xenorhabdus sp. 12]|uniref:MFS transporter n=1 Tax=Xenorhabdus santafensis TaxID=2582833 RepID=A0ABU4S6N1_9GAMM|nr:MFS transporter [Xenorhabdus sp. 12]MDX7986328.1 MFS transporter [Xenorhabdus sp. 12]